MTARLSALLGVLALITLGACDIRLNKSDIEGNPVHGFLPNPQTVTQTTDWNRTQTVKLNLHHYVLTPKQLSLTQGEPYQMIIENTGNYTCYFASEGLLKSIAVQKLVGPTGTKTFPYYEEISVLPGETKALYFVPVRAGHFPAECATTGFATLGEPIQISVQANPNFVAPAATGQGAIYTSYDGTTIAAPASPPASAQTLLQVEAAKIRVATEPELFAIKEQISDLILLIRERETQLQNAR